MFVFRLVWKKEYGEDLLSEGKLKELLILRFHNSPATGVKRDMNRKHRSWEKKHLTAPFAVNYDRFVGKQDVNPLPSDARVANPT